MPETADQALLDGESKVPYQVTGMDCLSCAAKIEKAARRVAGVAEAKVSMLREMIAFASEAYA